MSVSQRPDISQHNYKWNTLFEGALWECDTSVCCSAHTSQRWHEEVMRLGGSNKLLCAALLQIRAPLLPPCSLHTTLHITSYSALPPHNLLVCSSGHKYCCTALCFAYDGPAAGRWYIMMPQRVMGGLHLRGEADSFFMNKLLIADICFPPDSCVRILLLSF